MKLENIIKSKLGYKSVRPTGQSASGCISTGFVFEVTKDSGQTFKVFVKENASANSKAMFEGEFESLKAMFDTERIRVPKPVAVLDHPDTSSGGMLVMEFIEGLGSLSRSDEQLGKDLAQLHLDNVNKLKDGRPGSVSKFGFHVPTCCGQIAQANTWNENWVVSTIDLVSFFLAIFSIYSLGLLRWQTTRTNQPDQ